jgi:hypothetical protein
MPRRRIASSGWKKADGDLVLHSRLVDGQAEIVWEVLLNWACEGLDKTVSLTTSQFRFRDPQLTISLCYHLLSKKLDVFFVLRVATRHSERVYVSQIRFEEPFIAAICHAGILILGDLSVDIQVILAKLVQ